MAPLSPALSRFHVWRQALRSRRLNPHPPPATLS